MTESPHTTAVPAKVPQVSTQVSVSSNPFRNFNPSTDDRYALMRQQALRYAPVNVVAKCLQLSDILRFDAGDVMNCVGKRPYMQRMSELIASDVKRAQAEPSLREYFPKELYNDVRSLIARRFGIDEYGYSLPANGISDAMDIFIRAVSRWYAAGTGSKGRYLSFVPTYPSWLAAIICHDDISLLDIAEREKDGQPSLESFRSKLNEQTQVVFILTEENPLSISIKNDFYRNYKGTGLFDQIDKMIDKTGKPIIVALDVIYNSMAWSKDRLSIEDLIHLLGKKIITVFFDSASKIYGQAGLRAGAIGLRVPKNEEARRITRTLVADFEAEEAHILGISYAAMFALKHMLGGDAEIEKERLDALEIFRKRVPANFRKFTDSGLFVPVTHIEPNCAFYGLFELKDHNPWNIPEYKIEVWQKAIDLARDHHKVELGMMLQDMERLTPPARLPASEIFALDAYMNAGVQIIPGSRCYPVNRDFRSYKSLIRVVLGHDTEKTAQAVGKLEKLISSAGKSTTEG